VPYYLSRDPRHTVTGSIRAIGRLIRFLATFASCVVIVLGARAVSTRVTRGPGSVRLLQWLGRRLSRAAGIRVKRTGRRPATGGVIVANHLSWADSFVFLGELGARFVAMGLYRRIPVVGQALSAAGERRCRVGGLDSAAAARLALLPPAADHGTHSLRRHLGDGPRPARQPVE
jgi:hypothetical protein